jgi:regulator of nonsense transcripts 2
MAELTKFSVATVIDSLHYIKVLLDDFSSVSVELLCVFLESCGRFLFLSPNSSSRIAVFVRFLAKSLAGHANAKKIRAGCR